MKRILYLWIAVVSFSMAIPAFAGEGNDRVCLKFEELCDRFTLAYDPATGFYAGESDGCAFGYQPYSVYIAAFPSAWIVYLDFEDQGWPPDCSEGDYGIAFGSGAAGRIWVLRDCDLAASFPVHLRFCDITCYRDADYDGYGDPDVSRTFEKECGAGWVDNDLDCDDGDILTHIDALDLPDDGIDQDCDGEDMIRSDGNGIFVSPRGDDAGPGTMSAPKRTVQAGAVAAEAVAKAVYVAAGTYEESLESAVSLFGGYEDAGWTRDIGTNVTAINGSQGAAVTANAETASIAVEGFTINAGSGWYNTCGVHACSMLDENKIFIVNNTIDGGTSAWGYSYGVSLEDSSAILVNNIIDGGRSDKHYSHGIFLFRDSTATLVNNDIGGGTAPMWESYGVCLLHDSAATLLNNNINGCTTSKYSYGVFLDSNNTAMLVNNTIHGGTPESESYGVHLNESTATLLSNNIHGGMSHISVGVNLHTSTATMVNNIIDGGLTDDVSFAVYLHESTTTLVNNFIYGGTVESISFGVHVVFSTTTTLVNNTINGGSAGYISCGVFFSLYSTAALVNNIIDGGSADHSNGVSIYEEYSDFTSSLSLINNDIWGTKQDCILYYNRFHCIDDLAVVNLCSWPGCTEAGGNISDAPLFVDPENGEYHLTSESPCVDEGVDPAPWYEGGLITGRDFEGDTRPWGDGWDMGADEYTEQKI